jgi:predicted amidohydrolase
MTISVSTGNAVLTDNGVMRALLAAINCPKGAVDVNLDAHLQLLAGAAPGDLVLFPEMSLTGYLDPILSANSLARLDHPAVLALVAATGNAGVCACFGIAERGPDGLPYITQVVAADGKLLGVQRKRYLGEGEEAFTAASGDAVFEHGGIRFGIAICAEAGHDPPFDAAASRGATLVLFPAAPGLYGRRTDEESWRRGLHWWEGCSRSDASRHAKRLGLWIAQAGQAGVTHDEDFPGLAALTGPDGVVTGRLPDWRAGVLTVTIPAERAA